jgi:hypothetical protein
MGDGIGILREQRGQNNVTFNEVADHLFDYCDLHPEEAASLHRFAAFLAAVEFVPHDHDADPDRGIPAQPSAPWEGLLDVS